MKLVRGIPRVPALREGTKGKTRHGDYAIALALAHFTSRMRWVETGYRAAPDPRLSRDESRLRDRPDDDAGERGWWQPPLGTGLRGGLI